MLEIIALPFLSRNNGKLAVTKGLKLWTWIMFTILSWLGFELAGAIMGILIFGWDNLVPAYLLAVASGVLGYFFIRDILQKKDDMVEEDTNRTRVSDLYPEKK
jgi:hypothetical protein